MKKLRLEPTGQNHRISVTEPLCFVIIHRDRDPYASTHGFKPAYRVDDTWTYRLGLPGVVGRYVAIPREFGFDITKDSVGVWDIRNLPKTTRLKDIERPYDFPLEVMFQKGEWCLLEVGATEMIQIDYVWDSVETRTREVTKTRQVPYQVEKQRTVTATKQVPIWEVIFGK